jgi:iron complex transport system ATP-binding protein
VARPRRPQRRRQDHDPVVHRLLRHGGSVAIGETQGESITPRRRARLVALVPQRPVLPPALTVAEYVLLGRTPHIGYLDVETERDRAIAASAIERLGIARFAHRRLDELSGGEQQRERR